MYNKRYLYQLILNDSRYCTTLDIVQHKILYNKRYYTTDIVIEDIVKQKILYNQIYCSTEDFVQQKIFSIEDIVQLTIMYKRRYFTTEDIVQQNKHKF